MQLTSITMAKYGPYNDKLTLTVPKHGKVAVVGENGAGKSFFFDAITLALFGKATNRPKGIYELFNDANRQPVKDGLLELTFALNGKTVVVKRMVDSVLRKQLATITVDGVATTEGKVAEFEAEVARLGLNEQVFLTSAYASQNGAGHIISIGDGDRRGVFEVILGLREYAHAYELVKQERLTVASAKDKLTNKREALQRDTPEIDKLNGDLAIVKTAREAKAYRMAGLATTMQAQREEVAKAVANAQAYDRLEGLVGQVDSKVAALSVKQADLTERLANNKALLAQGAELQAAVELVATLRPEVAELRQAIEAKQTQAINLETEHRQKLEAQRGRYQQSVDDAKATLSTASEQGLRLTQQYNTARSVTVAATERLEQAKEQAKLKEQVPCDGQPLLANTCPLLQAANTAAYSIKRLEDELAEAKLAEGNALSATEKQMKVASIAHGTLGARELDLKIFMDKEFNAPFANPLLAEFVADKEALATKEQALAQAEVLANRAANLSLAEERIADYETQLLEIEQELTTLANEKQQHLTALEAAKDVAETKRRAQQALAELEAEQATVANELAGLDRQIGGLESDIQRATANLGELNELTKQITQHLAELAKLEVLEEGLSPKGAPALKVDAAGPEVTSLINDLLLACYGNRFTVRLDTQRGNRTNDNMREVIQMAVIDNESGDEAPVESLSGGEQAIVKEAISLGLAVFARRHCGVDIRCLIRDETTAPLSDENGERYIKMLDRALEVGGFEQVLFVSHKQSLQAMADHTVVVSNGSLALQQAA